MFVSGYGLIFWLRIAGGGFKKMKASTKKAMRKLIYYAAQQVKSDLTCAEAVDDREQDRQLSFLLNISIDSWRQDYKERWLLIKSRCLSLNRTALLNAAEKRSEIIKRHRQEVPFSFCKQVMFRKPSKPELRYWG
ncbi:bacteriophage antitermination protein Q [Escherichia coli]